MSQSIWDLADEIVNSVSDAIKTENYSGLSEKIKNSVNEATATAREKIRESQRTYNTYYDEEQGKYVNTENIFSSVFSSKPNNNENKTTLQQSRVNNYGDISKAIEEKFKPTGSNELVVCKDNKIPGRISSHIKYGTGIAGTALLAGPAVVSAYSFGTAIAANTMTAGIAGLFVLSATAIGCTITGITNGRKQINKNKRFKIYKNTIGRKGYCSIEDLSKEVGKSKNYVRRDLKKMIKEKYFLEGHFDNEENTFITSDNVYNNYLHAEEVQRQLLEQKKEVLNKSNEEEISRETVEEKTIVDEGKEYIAKIREANYKIPNPEMTKKLDTMEDIMIRIFDRVEKEPTSSEELRRMMKYYLPTTVKLLNAYIELDGQPSYGDNNIAKSKKEIEDTLDVINEAFGNLFDSMFEDTAWDISSDISAMKTMMKQDGLTGNNDFKND